MITVVGINHRSARLALREALALDPLQSLAFLAEARAAGLLEEGVVVSTCNRTEVYGTRVADAGPLIAALARFKGREVDASFFYVHRQRDAVRHLFRVASGLDSMVLGENEILGQVRTAYRLSLEAGHAAAVLDRLFSGALETGKKVRAETSINRGASSVSQAAVELCSREFPDLAARPVLLVGAGENGRLVLQSLAKRGNRRILVANRTRGRAEDLASGFAARVVSMGELDRALEECDVVLASTSSPVPLVAADAVERALERRGGRPLLLIDLSVPRNVERRVGSLAGVRLLDMDDLQAHVREGQAGRRGEARKAERLVDEGTDAFMRRMETFDLKPLIGELRGRLERARDAEVAAFRPAGDAADPADLSRLAEGVNRRILGLVIRNIRRMAEEGRWEGAESVVRELFDLENPS